MKNSKNTYKKIINITLLFTLLFANNSCAHSGRTDGYGGHYNRSSETYHYHSGKYAGTGEYTAPLEQGGHLINEGKSVSNYNESINTKTSSSSKNIGNSSNNISINNKTLTKTESPIWVKNIIGILMVFAIPIFSVIYTIIEKIKDSIEKKKLKSNNIEKKITVENSSNIQYSNVVEKNPISKTQKYFCPKCGSRLVVKKGKYGKFIGCSNYPYCKYTRKYSKI